MATYFDHIMQTRQAGQGKMVVGKSDQEKADDTKKGITVTAAIFFDGTLNNRVNTTERIHASGVFKEMDDDESSYDNYYSNVAILAFMNARKKAENKQVSVYVEGEGTEDRLTDKRAGAAVGTGITGIPAKVMKGMDELVGRINKRGFYDSKEERIDKLIISVFGFSRGSAAARHFISRKAELCARLRIKPTVVEFTFVGLFDTVSSYGATSFNDDVDELKLRLTDPGIKKVVHLVAGNEYRENFASTSIASAIAAGVGYELTLPGAHSDVGGGYAEVERESRTESVPELRRLLAEGWYRKEQVNFLLGQGLRTIPYHYQLITLGIMDKLATKYGILLTATIPREVHLQIPPDLLPARNELVAQALHKDGPHSVAATLSLPWLHYLRNVYLHRSVSEGTGMQGNFEDDKPTRIPIPG